MTFTKPEKKQVQMGRSPSLISISTTSTSSLNYQYKRSSVVPPPSKMLYNLQLKILTWSTCISIVTFLFFSMNLYAFVTLMIFAFSAVLTLHTTWQYLKHLIRNGEMLKMLPDQTRYYILEASLHEALIDATNCMYHRNSGKLF